MIKGLFRIKSTKNNNKNNVEGTAFAIEHVSAINKYFVVTAYHVLAEIISKNESILLEDEEGSFTSANYLSTIKNLSDYEIVGNDFAVLEAFTDKEYEVYKSLDYTEINSSTLCTIKGANIFFEFPFIPFTAVYEGTVKDKNGKDILCLNVLTSDFLNNKKQPVSTQELFKGASGAPVIVNYHDQEYCIGILAQVNDSYRNPTRLAVPIFYVANDIAGFGKEAFEIQPSNISPGDYIDAIFGFNNEFVFSDDEEDKRIWNNLSNAHFREGNIDLKLQKVVQSQDFESKSAEIKCAILYYYARLLFKRGRIKEAQRTLEKLQGQSTHLSEQSNKKVAALVRSRRIVEDIGQHFNNPGNILRAADWLDRNLKSPEYKAYEMASIFGKGIMNLFQAVNDLNEAEKIEVIQIYNNQKELHKKYPAELKKQEVVITAVEWFIELWNASGNLCMDDIDSTIEIGFSQARSLHNNIFHAQCLLAMVISYLIKDKKASAVSIFTILSRIMNKMHITFKNEGISQLMKYIYDNYNPFYFAFMLIHDGKRDTNDLLLKLDNLHIDLENSSWKNAMENGINVYNHLYAPTSNIREDIQPYNIKYNELMLFF